MHRIKGIKNGRETNDRAGGGHENSARGWPSLLDRTRVRGPANRVAGGDAGGVEKGARWRAPRGQGGVAGDDGAGYRDGRSGIGGESSWVDSVAARVG